ncbi:hypothetical protein BLOT_006798 [Blomia tropicalis]|nr:hypothetical protein BLOT_006798 [Blomia tropicalis]
MFNYCCWLLFDTQHCNEFDNLIKPQLSSLTRYNLILFILWPPNSGIPHLSCYCVTNVAESLRGPKSKRE